MRALGFGLRPIVIVNKADRPNADPSGALDKTFDLFVELGANNEQSDFPVLYGSGLEGWIVSDLDEYQKEEREREEHLADGGTLSAALLKELSDDLLMNDLFETIISDVPAPQVYREGAVPHADQHARVERRHRPHRLRARARRRPQDRRRAAAHHHAAPRDRRSRRRLGVHRRDARTSHAPLGHARPREPRGRRGRSPATSSGSRAPTRSVSATRWPRWSWTRPPSVAAARDRRADGEHVLPRQQRPVRRPGRPPGHAAPDQGPSGARAARQRRAPRRRPRPPGRRQGERPRRAAPRDPHRGDAPRGHGALRGRPR